MQETLEEMQFGRLGRIWLPVDARAKTFQSKHTSVDKFLAAFGAGRVEIVPAWNDFVGIPSPYGAHQPSCYRRLRAFHPDIAATLGDRFVSLDLDTVITGDVRPLWDRPEDFIAWGETNPKSYYNGSMFELRAGARPQVWTLFDPKRSPAAAKAAGNFGSDQGWLSHCLGKGEPTWTTQDGVYSYNVHLRNKTTTLPANARIVMFHGGTDPWVREHYR